MVCSRKVALVVTDAIGSSFENSKRDDADNVWVLKPEDSEQDETETSDALPVDLNIVKARNGPRGKVRLVFLQPYTRFENAARVETEPNHNYGRPRAYRDD